MRSPRRLLLAALTLVVLGAAPAVAHSDDGTMTVTSATVEGESVRLEVGVLYADEDLAEEATVSATLTEAGGGHVGPVPLRHVSGARYGATVDLPGPGEWTAAITSTSPAAEATTTFTVTSSPSTTNPAPSTTAEPDSSVPDITVPATRQDTDDDSASALPWVVAGVVVMAIAAAAIAIRRRR